MMKEKIIKRKIKYTGEICKNTVLPNLLSKEEFAKLIQEKLLSTETSEKGKVLIIDTKDPEWDAQEETDNEDA
jgi:hypothetical protein